MAKSVNLLNFPEDLHRRVKVQAAKEGLTIKALIIKLLERYLEEKGG